MNTKIVLAIGLVAAIVTVSGAAWFLMSRPAPEKYPSIRVMVTLIVGEAEKDDTFDVSIRINIGSDQWTNGPWYLAESNGFKLDNTITLRHSGCSTADVAVSIAGTDETETKQVPVCHGHSEVQFTIII